MKIAVVMSGLSKGCNRGNVDCVFRLFPEAEISILVSTWTHCDIALVRDELRPHVLDVEDYGLVSEVLDDEQRRFRFFIETKSVKNTLAMWYKWSRLAELIRAGSFDLIVKSRLDAQIRFADGPFLRAKLERAAIGSSQMCIPAGGDHVGGLSDVVAIASPRLMSDYLRLWENRIEAFRQSGLFHPESILRQYQVKKRGKEIFRPVVPIYLYGTANREDGEDVFYNPDGQREFVDRVPYRRQSLAARVRYQLQRRNVKRRVLGAIRRSLHID